MQFTLDYVNVWLEETVKSRAAEIKSLVSKPYFQNGLVFPMTLGDEVGVVTSLIPSIGKVFSTKTRAPYMIPLLTKALVTHTPHLQKEESKGSHSSEQFLKRMHDYDE